MTLDNQLQTGRISTSRLDEVVQEAASQLAANVNNQGAQSQIEFLLQTCNWTEQDILEEISRSD